MKNWISPQEKAIADLQEIVKTLSQTPDTGIEAAEVSEVLTNIDTLRTCLASYAKLDTTEEVTNINNQGAKNSLWLRHALDFTTEQISAVGGGESFITKHLDYLLLIKHMSPDEILANIDKEDNELCVKKAQTLIESKRDDEYFEEAQKRIENYGKDITAWVSFIAVIDMEVLSLFSLEELLKFDYYRSSTSAFQSLIPEQIKLFGTSFWTENQILITYIASLSTKSFQEIDKYNFLNMPNDDRIRYLKDILN